VTASGASIEDHKLRLRGERRHLARDIRRRQRIEAAAQHQCRHRQPAQRITLVTTVQDGLLLPYEILASHRFGHGDHPRHQRLILHRTRRQEAFHQMPRHAAEPVTLRHVYGRQALLAPLGGIGAIGGVKKRQPGKPVRCLPRRLQRHIPAHRQSDGHHWSLDTRQGRCRHIGKTVTA
jgi:hypothetical protein